MKLDAISALRLSLHVIHPSKQAAVSGLELQSRQMTCDHYLQHFQHVLNRCVYFTRVFPLIHITLLWFTDHEKQSQTGTKSNKHFKILFANHFKLFIKGFVFAPLIILLFVFQPRPSPVSVGYEGFYCKTTALNLYNRQAPDSYPLLWLVGTSTHVSESTKLLGGNTSRLRFAERWEECSR